MLDYFRKQSNSLVSTFLILVVAATMAFIWGTSKYDSDKDEGVAAWVNGEAISKREFAREYEALLYRYQSMLGDQFDEKFLQALQVPQHALDSAVRNKLLAQQARRVGIVIPDQELADYIRALPYFQKDGKFSYELYNRIPDRGKEEKTQREALAIQKYQNYLIDRVRLTPVELRTMYDLKETKIDIDYAEIQFDKLTASYKPSPSEIDSYLKTAEQADIKKYYDEHLKDFSEPAQVELHQIRVGLPFQASDTKKAEAKKKMEAITKKLTPENFAEVAKGNSDDEHAKKGGLVGWVKRGSLEPALEQAIDRLEQNRLSPLVETPFGLYLIKITGKKDQITQPIEKVKRQIGEKLALAAYKKRFFDSTRTEWEKLLASGKALDGELKKWKIETKKTGPFSAGGGYIPNIGQIDSVVDTVFSLTKKDPIAKKLVQVGDKYYYLKLRSVEYAKPGDFAKNAETTDKGSVTGLQGELLNQWVAQLEKDSSVKKEIQLQQKGPKQASSDAS